jgi:hypothetical protein
MATVLMKYATEEQYFVRFLWAKGLSATNIQKETFLFMVGSVCRVKQFATASRMVAMFR